MSETAESVIYKIINNETGELEGAYNRSYYTQYEFSSPGEARSSNVHNIFRNKREYRIQKWKVTYELVDDDCDPYRQEKIPRWSEVQFNQVIRDAIKNQFEMHRGISYDRWEELRRNKVDENMQEVLAHLVTYQFLNQQQKVYIYNWWGDCIVTKFEGVKLKGMGRPRSIRNILKTFADTRGVL